MIKDKETLIQLTIFPCLSDRLRSSVLDDLRTDRETVGQEEKDALSQLLSLLERPTDRPEWETAAMQSVRRHYLDSTPWSEVLTALQGFRVWDGSSVIHAVCTAVRPWIERRDSLLDKWQDLEQRKTGLHTSLRTGPRLENCRMDSGDRITAIVEKQDKIRPDLEQAIAYCQQADRVLQTVYPLSMSQAPLRERERQYLAAVQAL